MVASLGTVPAERRAGPEFRKAVGLLAHVAAARGMWLWRLGVAADRPAALFPADAEWPTAAAELRAVQERWAAYLDRLIDADLQQTFEYQSLDAGRFRNSVEEILTQLFGHSWYHRGQIAVLVRAAGGEPAVTDFVYWCREPVPAVNDEP